MTPSQAAQEKCLRCGASWVHRDDYAGLGTPHPYESSQAAQEKPTSPRTYDLDTDSGRELHQRIHPNGGRCPMLDGGPCIWQQRVKQVEREAAAATPSLAANQPCYRWEPVKNDCRRHHGPHEGFRCNGAIGRLIEVYHEAAAATPSLDVEAVVQEFGHYNDCSRDNLPDHDYAEPVCATRVADLRAAILSLLRTEARRLNPDYPGSTGPGRLVEALARLDEGSATPDQGKGEPR